MDAVTVPCEPVGEQSPVGDGKVRTDGARWATVLLSALVGIAAYLLLKVLTEKD